MGWLPLFKGSPFRNRIRNLHGRSHCLTAKTDLSQNDNSCSTGEVVPCFPEHTRSLLSARAETTAAIGPSGARDMPLLHKDRFHDSCPHPRCHLSICIF
ncbi:unnamed protein product [Gulo gulo]|uniref:Uncharacterized protein n=1 Tax=Gulo gulo TaxID=48420 RepID=A0A9X9M7G8_GULGU|nr:unnamed protein product [Gulo gulo]